MASTLEFIKAHQKDTKIEGFTTRTRTGELDTIAKGDRFIIPENFEVFEVTNMAGAQYVLAYLVDDKGEQLKDAEGKPLGRMFFPSTLGKSRAIVNADGTFTGKRAACTGSAVDKYKTYPQTQDFIEWVAKEKKTFVVTDAWLAKTLRFNTTAVTDTTFYNVDLV